MKKNRFMLPLTCLIVFSIFIPACPTLATEPAADTNIAIGANDVTSKTDDVSPTNSPPPKAIKKSPLPRKIFSVATAFIVGTPICIVRRSKYEEWYGVHGMIGDSDNKVKKIVAGTFWLPFAVVTGTLEAPFDATANGLMYPAFSKDQLSKGKLVQNN